MPRLAHSVGCDVKLLLCIQMYHWVSDWRSMLRLKLVLTCDAWMCGCSAWWIDECEWFDALALKFCLVCLDLYTLPDCQLLVSRSWSFHGSISIRSGTLASQLVMSRPQTLSCHGKFKLGHTSMATTRGFLSRVGPRAQIHGGFSGCLSDVVLLLLFFFFSFSHGQA